MLDDPGLQLEKIGLAAGPVALQRIARLPRLARLRGGGLLQVVLLRFGQIAISDLHLIELFPRELNVGLDLELTHLADVRQLQFSGELRLHHLEPQGLDPGLQPEIDQPVLFELPRLRRPGGAHGRSSLLAPRLQGRDLLKQLVPLDAKRLLPASGAGRLRHVLPRASSAIP